jgi:hypothetical protein
LRKKEGETEKKGETSREGKRKTQTPNPKNPPVPDVYLKISQRLLCAPSEMESGVDDDKERWN